jgi:hypothetical protein
MREYALATTLDLGVVFGKFIGLETFGNSNAVRSKGLNFGKAVKEFSGGSMVAASFINLSPTALVRRILLPGYAVKNAGVIWGWA